MIRCIATYLTLVLALSGWASSQSIQQQSAQKPDDAMFDCVLEIKAPDLSASRVNTLISLADVYAKAGRKERGLHLMSDAQKEAAIQAAKPQPQRLISLPPDPDRLAIDMTLGYLEMGALDHASEFSRGIANAPFRARTLARIAAAMAVEGDKEKAKGLLAEASKTVKNADDEPWGLAEISFGYAKLGDCEQARVVGLSMPDKWPYIKAPELAKIASECARTGSKKDATQLISESLRVVGLMKDKILGEEKYEVQALVASAQIDNGEKEAALQLLTQALAGSRKAEYSIRAHEYIAAAYVNAKLYENAEAIANSINYRPTQANILLSIARRYLGSGDKTNALSVLDRSRNISLDNKNEDATSRYKRLGEIAVEYANAGRTDRASEVLLEALREIRKHDFQQTELILSVFSGYAKSKVTPDETARQLIRELCTGEAFELTSVEIGKKRRVEEAADRFIERWHQTLDLNVLFEEMYVSNPKLRQINGRLFRGVYQFLSASAWGPGVNKDVGDELLRDAFFAFWNMYYMSDEYQMAYQTDEQGGLVDPPELKRMRASMQRRKLNEKRITRTQAIELRDGFKGIAAVYRKYLRADTFKSATYLKNLSREDSHENEFEKRFQISPGFPGFGVPDNVEVFYLQKGVFRFYFVEEEGKLRVLTLGFEL